MSFSDVVCPRERSTCEGSQSGSCSLRGEEVALKYCPGGETQRRLTRIVLGMCERELASVEAGAPSPIERAQDQHHSYMIGKTVHLLDNGVARECDSE
jgi:hypothetical protein